MSEHDGSGEILQSKSIILKAELTEDGNLKVECPKLAEQLFMLGFIEQIKLAVIQHNVAIRQSKIVKPNFNFKGAFGKKRF